MSLDRVRRHMSKADRSTVGPKHPTSKPHLKLAINDDARTNLEAPQSFIFLFLYAMDASPIIQCQSVINAGNVRPVVMVGWISKGNQSVTERDAAALPHQLV